MFLRSLTIRGFKSFADKTTLEFAPGVSVIVGPNGSGKSNLVDAIAWVLGEQGPRALRGGQMADVIFAGSPQRPALGMAEVKLVIDNSAGLIPVPMSEIEISRAIYRSGDSEYRIGGRVARLLDVQELLAETGIGRALHTVVGQGQLEDVLTSRPEDRRQYIEEAAGIAKHRKRRERAERKLAGLEQDVLRLQDVLAELRRQLKPLRQQAEVAKRHEELTAEADLLAVKLAAARLRDLLAERRRRTAGWDEGLARRTQARARLDALDDAVGTAADDHDRGTAALAEAEELLAQAQAAKSSAELALRGAVAAESAARADLAAQAGRDVRIGVLDEDLERIRSRQAEIAAELSLRERELDAAEAAFRAAQELRRNVEDQRHRIGEQAAAHRAEMETLQRSLSAYERDRGHIAQQLAMATERRETAEAERGRLSDRIDEIDAQVAPLSDRQAELERERHTIADSVAGLEDLLRRHETRRDVLLARKADLEETPGSRLRARHPGRSLGLLSELIEIEDGWERALAAAIGPFGDAVVYAGETIAIEDAPRGDGATLAVAGGGPVAFVVPGERTLLSLVTVVPETRGLISTLLKDVYLSATLEEAVEKHHRFPKASFVTREGVLVGPAVIRTAPHADAPAEQIGRELRVVEHDLSQTKTMLRPKRQRVDAIGRELEQLTARIEAADAAITQAADAIGRLGAEVATAAKEEEILAQRLGGMDDAAASWRAALDAASPISFELPALPPLAEPPVQQRVAVETLRRDRASLGSRLGSVQRERDGLVSTDPDARRAAVHRTTAERGAAEERLGAAEEALVVASERRAEAASTERAASAAEAAANRAWREAATELERLREAYEDEDRMRGDLLRRIKDAERLLRDGHQRDPAEVVGKLTDEDTVAGLEKRAELVQRRLALLGRVNLLAGGEFEALQERHDFLQRELGDVRKARRDLLEVIQRIDLEITTTFGSALRDVCAEFERLFAELFPGGEGRLVATEPVDLLNTGIEIEARPGRKRVKRLSLLSGGERALTALAFLFAIFEARPSPFYLMDEVEPALDDVNLHRFLRLVQGFASDSQVLIVTHQKRTMEVAQMMYGVSMHKDGTTKVIAQRLEAPDADTLVPPPAHAIAVPEADPVH